MDEEPIPLTDALLRAHEEVNTGMGEKDAALVEVTKKTVNGIDVNAQAPQDPTELSDGEVE